MIDKELIEYLGDTVICDICNKDWTGDDTSGGILVGSYAVCPDCTPKKLKDLEKYNEMHCINARCPEKMSFADWVVDGRGSEGGKIIFITGDDNDSFEDMLRKGGM